MEKVYKIKNSLRLPMLLAVILSIPVFADLMGRGMETGHIILIVILMLFFYLMAINNLIRRVAIREDSITIGNFMGRKTVAREDITALDGLSVGQRQFISLIVGKRSHLIQNSYSDFTGIMDTLSGMVPEDHIKEGFTRIRQNPLTRSGDTIAAWLTVAILMTIITFRYLPH
jgi:hypothetical protein